MLRDGWGLDLRYAVRGLFRRSSASSAGAVTILGVGAGVAAAIFGLADPFLARPLPYARAHELAVMTVAATADESALPTLDALRRRTDLFADAGAIRDQLRRQIEVDGATRLVQTLEVTDNLLTLLGTGGNIESGTAGAGEVPLILTTAGRKRLFGDADVPLGRLLRGSDGPALRISGVLPESFVVPRARRGSVPDGLVPFAPAALVESDAGRSRSLTVIARLRTGASVGALPGAIAGAGATALSAVSMRDYLTGDLRPIAGGAVASAFLLLLICAANVGNLSLARGLYRQHEHFLRVAIGAGWRQIGRLLCLEHFVLAAAGIGLALAVVSLSLSVAARAIPPEYAVLGPPRLTSRVVVFAAGAVVLCVAGALAVRIATARTQPLSLGSASSGPRPLTWLRRSFVFAQSAVTMVLLANGGLLLASYRALTVQNFGLDPDAVAVSVLAPPRITEREALRRVEETLRQLQHLPEASHAGASIGALLDSRLTVTHVRTSGSVPQIVSLKFVSDGYFEAMGTRFVSGGWPERGAGFPPAAISEGLARILWPAGDAVGRLVRVGNTDAEVVAVVADVFDRRMDTAPWKTVHLPLGPAAFATRADLSYVVAPSRAGARALGAIRSTVERANPDAVVADASTLGERLSNTVRARTFVTFVTNLFAFAAALVCVTGLAAMVGYTVTRRTREIAVRMALGLEVRAARRLVIKEVVATATLGIVAGVAGGAWVSGLLGRFLYGVRPAEPVVLIGAVVVAWSAMAAVAWAAAARIPQLDAWQTLRAE